MSEQPEHTQTPGVTRRATLLAATWAAPAVTVVVAAPAYAAASGQLTITGFTASYATGAPETLHVSATVQGFSGGSYEMALVFPAGLFDTVTAPSGAPVNTLAGGTVTVTSTSPEFTTALTLGGTGSSPWRGWSGPQFVLAAMVTSGVVTSEAASTGVAGYLKPTDKNIYDGRSTPTATLATTPMATTLRFAADWMAVSNVFAGVVGRLVLVINVPKVGTRPVPAALHSQWEIFPVTDLGDSWLFRYRTKTSFFTSRALASDKGPAPDAGGGGAFMFWTTLTGADPALALETARFYYSLEGDTEERDYKFTRIN